MYFLISSYRNINKGKKYFFITKKTKKKKERNKNLTNGKLSPKN